LILQDTEKYSSGMEITMSIVGMWHANLSVVVKT
jgi:hypothetical protein